MPETYDGVRPRNAVCLKCGYEFGGVEIRGGIVVCPECGHPNRFVLEPPKGAACGLRVIRFLSWLTVLAIAVVIIVLLLT